MTVTAAPGNPWRYNSDLIFKQGANEIARQHTDMWGNITPVSGAVPDGIAKGYFPDGKLMMEIPFLHNHAQGVGHSFDESSSLVGDESYEGGYLHGTQTGYYSNGKIKTQGEWRYGTPVGLHKLFDEQGRLEMTTEEISTETRFYPNVRKKSAWTYRGDEWIEASEYREDGRVRVHATKHASLDECRVRSDKSLYASGDAVGFSLVCRCEATGCFSPGLKSRFHPHYGWTGNLVIERGGIQYQPLFCPMCANLSIAFYSKEIFKDGEQIAHVVYDCQQQTLGSCDLRWVDRTAYAACSNQFECIEKVFNRSAGSLPAGSYTAWLDAGNKPAKTSFTILAGK